MRFTSFVSGFAILFAAVVMAAQGDTFLVSGDQVNVRAGPDTKTKVLFAVNRDEPAIELARRDGWVQVELPKRRAGGWIHQSLLKEPGAPSPPATVVANGDAGRVAETEQAAAALKATESLAAATPPKIAEPAPLSEPPKIAEPPAAAEPEATSELPKWTESPQLTPPSPATEPAVQPAETPVAVEASPAPTTTTAATPAAPTTTAPTITAPSTTTPTTLAAPVTPPAPTTTTAAVDVARVPTTDPVATAAPAGDEPASVTRFRDSVQYLNERALAAAGIDLFTDVRSAGGGTVQVLATETWSMVPEGGQESYMNTLFSSWSAAVGGNQALTLQIVDPSGQIVMERSGP